MDFENLQGGGQLECVPLDISLLPPLYLLWANSPSESGKVCVCVCCICTVCDCVSKALFGCLLPSNWAGRQLSCTLTQLHHRVV
jgi:hypothetical protein